MKINLNSRYMVPVIAIAAFGISVTSSTQSNAISLAQSASQPAVLGLLGDLLGLNNSSDQTQSNTPTPATSTPTQSTPAAQVQSTQQPQTTTAPAQTAQAITPSTTPATAQLAQTTTSTTTRQVQAVSPATIDTGAISRQLASAQSNRSIAPVTYTTNQISNDVRDELFAIAAVVSVVGAALYGMTFIGSAQSVPAVTRRPLYVK